MVACFAPGCNHTSSFRNCSFYRFPADIVQWRRWVRAIRRADRKPSAHSRLCSCHFPKGKKKAPVLFVSPNYVPIGQKSEDHSYCMKGENTDGKETGPPAMDVVEEEITQLVIVKVEEEEVDPLPQAAVEAPQPLTNNVEEPSSSKTVEEELQSERIHRIQLEIQLEESKAELRSLKDKQLCRYSASQLSESVIRMETGLPDGGSFSALCEYVARFEDSINYQAGWSPKELILEDQIFMTLMKLRHNYTDLHLATLFHCGVSTVRNVSVTFTELLQRLLCQGDQSISIASTRPSTWRRLSQRLAANGANSTNGGNSDDRVNLGGNQRVGAMLRQRRRGTGWRSQL